MESAPEIMNVRQAAEYLGVSADWLYKHAMQKEIPAFKLGNRWKFKKTALDNWMDQKSATFHKQQRVNPSSAE